MGPDPFEASSVEPLAGEGEGLHPNQAWSVDVVVRSGMAVLQEIPREMMLAAGGLTFLMLLPSLFSFAGSFIDSFARSSHQDELLVVGVGLRFAQIAVQILSLPFAYLLRAGIGQLAARHIQGETVEIADVYRHVEPAVRLFVYGLASAALGAVLVVVVLVPLTLAVFALGWVMAEQDIPTFAAFFGVAILIVLVPAAILCSFATRVLTLAGGAASVADEWTPNALRITFSVARQAPVTLSILLVVMGVANLIAFLSVGCLVGLAIVPAVTAVFEAGLMASYLLYTRKPEEVQRWEFFRRNTLIF